MEKLKELLKVLKELSPEEIALLEKQLSNPLVPNLLYVSVGEIIKGLEMDLWGGDLDRPPYL